MTKSRSEARWESLTIPTYAHQPGRQLPMLFQHYGSLFPERMDDILGGARREVSYPVIVLENEFLRLTVVPELGGKLWSVFDKAAGQETLYVPDCVKPGLIARPGAWIPGGMEFNFPVGHHPRTLQPLPCSILDPGPEQAAMVIEQRCPRTGMHLTVHIRLRAGEARFDIAYELLNPTPLAHGWYQWTNVGMLATPEWQFLSKANLCTMGGAIRQYPVGRSGADQSFFRNRPICSDTFMVAHREDFCGCYDHGRKHGLVHVSPWRQMRGKKYFTWGFHYPEYSDGTVFCDNGAHYVEIQFGPMETQMERAMLAAGQGLAYAETWIPFRATGGFDWADRSLLFNAGADGTWLYAAVPLRVRIAAGGKAIERDLKPAEPTRLGLKINPGAEVELCVNDKLARAFRFPLAGRQEPGGAARAERQYNPKPRGKPTRAPDFLQAAREAALADMWPQAIHYYRKSLELAPRQAQVRLELADALWHIGDFAAGAAELQRLLKGPLSDQAKLKLEQRALVEARFFAPVKALPEGPERDLALAEQFAGYGGNEAAAGIYRRLLRTARNNPRVHYGLAMYWQHACGKRLQGLRHARRALALSGYARDYVIELAPLFLSAHRYRELIGLVRRSAPAVQALSFVRKLLVQAWFELGEFGRCQAIFAAPEPIYSWEGEMGMADLFVLSAAALAERALLKNDLAAAARWARTAGRLPATIGIPHRYLEYPGYGYWQGAVLARQGKSEEARRVWRRTLEDWEKEHQAVAAYFNNVWGGKFVNPENAFLMGLCALRLGDAALLRRAREQFRQIKQKHGTPFFEGLLAELEGDFKTAAACYKKQIASAPHSSRLARLHLAAVAAGRRRGE